MILLELKYLLENIKKSEKEKEKEKELKPFESELYKRFKSKWPTQEEVREIVGEKMKKFISEYLLQKNIERLNKKLKELKPSEKIIEIPEAEKTTKK